MAAISPYFKWSTVESNLLTSTVRLQYCAAVFCFDTVSMPPISHAGISGNHIQDNLVSLL